MRIVEMFKKLFGGESAPPPPAELYMCEAIYHFCRTPFFKSVMNDKTLMERYEQEMKTVLSILKVCNQMPQDANMNVGFDTLMEIERKWTKALHDFVDIRYFINLAYEGQND